MARAVVCHPAEVLPDAQLGRRDQGWWRGELYERFCCGEQATKVRGSGQSRKVLAMESFYTMPQYEAWKEVKPPGSWEVKYYKVRAALRLPWTRVSVDR